MRKFLCCLLSETGEASHLRRQRAFLFLFAFISVAYRLAYRLFALCGVVVGLLLGLADGGGGAGEPELDRLSNIIKQFNDLFGNIEWHDADKIRKVVTEEIPARVAQDKAYQNAQANSGKQNARIEHDKALNRVVLELLDDHTELFKQFSDNPHFKRWLADMVFDTTYHPGRKPPVPPQPGAQA